MDRVGIKLEILVWVPVKGSGATQEQIWKKRMEREGSTADMMGNT